MAFSILSGMCFRPGLVKVGVVKNSVVFGPVPRAPHRIAFALDLIMGLGALAVGLLAMHGVIPLSSTVTNAFLVGGGVYSGLMLLKGIDMLKRHICFKMEMKKKF